MRSFLFLIILCLFTIPVFSQDLLLTDNKFLAKTMSQRWELDEPDKLGTFRLTSYNPFYITAGRRTNSPNTLPQSENPLYSASESKPYNNYEARFQLSFKTKVLQSFLFGHGDLWLGYTQVAHWQIYNTDLSRAFREMNFEPELILNFPINFNFIGFKVKMAGVGFNHQSNGRDLPYSRSWNRVMFHIGMERNNLQIFLKPWIRLVDEEDENPLITDYIGRAQANVIYKIKKHNFYVVGTNSLSFPDNHGSIQFNYIYPIKAHLRAQLQIFNGYGETLIDYNHKQTTVGLGISFVDW